MNKWKKRNQLKIMNMVIMKNNKIFYYGAQWGTHVPTNVVDFITEEVESFNLYEWLLSLGYNSVLEEET